MQQLQRASAIVFGLGFVLNAAGMLVRPLGWYSNMPGVAATGPFNSHFIRDIGCAYLAVAISLFWLGRSPRTGWPAAMIGGAFLILHALVHAFDFYAGREPAHQLLGELTTVFLPAIVVIWLAWPVRRAAKE